MKAFLSHSSKDSEFVCQVAGILKRHLNVVYYEDHQYASNDFMRFINDQMRACDVFIFFVGKSFVYANYMEDEALVIAGRPERERGIVILVALDGFSKPAEFPRNFPEILGRSQCIRASDPVSTAKEIIEYLKIPWNGADGLPYNSHLFSYEKDIIDFYACRKILGSKIFHRAENPDHQRGYDYIRSKFYDGCPMEWPQVVDMLEPGQARANGLKNYGDFRDRNARVAASALHGLYAKESGFYFLEAGPRKELAFPMSHGPLRVGILVSGGIAPGINAVIDGIVQRHWLYAQEQNHRVEITGYLNGFHAFDPGRATRYATLFPKPTSKRDGVAIPMITAEHANEGGSMLGTSRLESLMDPNQRISELQRIIRILQGQGIDILYLIGGDGTMKAAHALWGVAKELVTPQRGRVHSLSVVAIPKTMDNDILWMWQSFGFLSAVEKAREVVEHLHTEVKSNPRLCVVQLFGSDSGFVVSHAVLASAAGQCDLALIPEVPFSLLGIAQYLAKRIRDRDDDIPRALVVLAETAIPVDVSRFLDPETMPFPEGFDNETKELISGVAPIELSEQERSAIKTFEKNRQEGKRFEGQTSDHLRKAGLKVVMQGLEKLLPLIWERIEGGNPPDRTQLRVMANEPRHLLRAIPPSTSDIIMGQRLGILAVDNAMAGFTDFMIGQWLTEFVLVPLELVVLGRKRIPDSGIFWKSVLAKTGQPPDLVAPWPARRDASPVNLATFRTSLQEDTKTSGAL